MTIALAAFAIANWSRTGTAGRERGEVAADRDGDGIADRRDRCPDRAGLSPDGCPPQDRDGDGVLDRSDRCPNDPGPRGNDGCPDTDGDGDGTVDRIDRCRDIRGHRDFAGCPAPDRDRDGVADPDDRCVTQPEVWNGKRDRDGCPDRGKALVVVSSGRVSLARGRVFRKSGRLATRGRKAVAVAAAALKAVRARKVRVVVTIGSADREAAAERAGVVASALRKRLRGVTIEIASVPDPEPDERYSRVVLAYE